MFDQTQLLGLVAARANSRSSADQNVRWGRQYLDWLRGQGLDLSEDDSQITRDSYRRALEAAGDLRAPKAWAQRASAINRLREAELSLQAQAANAAPARCRTHLVDTARPGSLLDLAIGAVVASGKDGPRRRVLRAELGQFLAYCIECGVDPTTVGPADLRLYRRHLLPTSRSANQLVTTARRLVREVAALRPSPHSGPEWIGVGRKVWSSQPSGLGAEPHARIALGAILARDCRARA